ncbi:MAG: zf-HC2 domain-containing protein [Armatimonadota bacterium]
MRGLAGLRCGRVRKRRWRYLDNTLSTRERAWVDRHLAQCIGCRTEFARAAFVLESLQKGLPLEPDLLPSRPKRWLVGVSLLIALLGLIGGIGLVRFSNFALPTPTRSLSPATSPFPSKAESGVQALSPPPEKGLGVQVNLSAAAPSLHKAPSSHRVGKGQRVRTNAVTYSVRKRAKVQAQSKKRSPNRQKAAPSRPLSHATPPEGTVEVFDESGQLVKRAQLRGTR